MLTHVEGSLEEIPRSELVGCISQDGLGCAAVTVPLNTLVDPQLISPPCWASAGTSSHCRTPRRADAAPFLMCPWSLWWGEAIWQISCWLWELPPGATPVLFTHSMLARASHMVCATSETWGRAIPLCAWKERGTRTFVRAPSGGSRNVHSSFSGSF